MTPLELDRIFAVRGISRNIAAHGPLFVWAGECIAWKGSHRPDGYAQAHYQGRTQKVSPIVERLTHPGVAQDWGVLSQECGNRWCVNPDHLVRMTARAKYGAEVGDHPHMVCGKCGSDDGTTRPTESHGKVRWRFTCTLCTNAYKSARRGGDRSPRFSGTTTKLFPSC